MTYWDRLIANTDSCEDMEFAAKEKAKAMNEQDIVERATAIMHRDDCLDAMVPSDICQLVGRIERLRAELAAEKEAREKAEDRASALNKIGVDTQMLAHKWMVAHDRLKAGLPYDFPKPADTPECIAKLEKAEETLRIIAKGDTTTFDDELQCDVQVAMSEDEMSDFASTALAALGDD